MPPTAATASANTMISRPTQPAGAGPSSAIDPNPNAFSIREFVVDEDAANFNSSLWKSIDQSAFVLAQREALEAFNVAKAMRLSEETAAEESRRRAADSAIPTHSFSDLPPSSAEANTVGLSSCTQSQALAIRIKDATPLPAAPAQAHSSISDEAAARSLARTWQVDGLQPALLENKPSSSSLSITATPTPKTETRPHLKSSSSGSVSASASAALHDFNRKASSFASASASASAVALAKQPSPSVSQSQPQTPLSLSTVSSSSFFQVSSSSASDPFHHQHHQHIRASSQSQLHTLSASTSNSNSVPSTSASSASASRTTPSPLRSLSTRDPEPSAAMAPTIANTPSSRDVAGMTSSSAKRTRTERQPQSSSTSTSTATASGTPSTNTQAAQALVAPPMSPDTKKSTSVSARDVRMGQIMNPATGSATMTNTCHGHPKSHASQSSQSQPQQSQSQPRSRRSKSTSHGQVKEVKETQAKETDIFTATRGCTGCGRALSAPQSQSSSEYDPFAYPFADLLHVTCSACRTTHCRGCFSVARCPTATTTTFSTSSTAPSATATSTTLTTTKPASCVGGPACKVINCCPAVRAVAIFEALSAFDSTYLCEAGFFASASTSSCSASGSVPSANHQGNGGSDNAKAGDGAKRKGHSIGVGRQQRQAYLKALIAKPDRTTRRCEDGFVRTLKLLCGWLQAPPSSSPSSTTNAPHATIPRLLAHSLLPEVMHAFLANTNVRDWVAHSETYLALLDALRRIADACPALLNLPHRGVERSAGLRAVVWGQGAVVWAEDKDSTTNGDGENERHTGFAPPLCDVVRGLEAHRAPLMALAAKLQFSATLEKVNNLCDGISYLLLQQVVGGF